MSSKKTKLLESAQKNVFKGQLDRAIVEYRQLIELDPADLRHRQKIAELLTKANRKEEAIKEYASLAKHYIDSVHYLKAIAVYKQIQKIDPENPETSLTLASLNEKQGLIGNAIAEHATAVQIYEKSGENLKALKALEAIMLLDSSNAAVKLRIAEKYFSTGSEDKSFETFQSLLTELKERNDENGYNLIAARAANLFGDRFHDFQTLSPPLPSDGNLHQAGKAQPAVAVPHSPQSMNIQPEPYEAPDDSVPTEAATAELPEAAHGEEVDYIEELLPLEDDEPSFSETSADWEEEIDIPSFDGSFASDGTLESGQEIIEEIEAIDDLDEIELELDVAADLSQESPPEAPPAEDSIDLGKELSQFADEIDFGLFGEEGQDTTFDSTAYGFKKGELDNEDTESHYSLGLAYKEMGLWDEAIGEFIVASRSPLRRIDALTLQGVCLRELGNVAKAVEMLSDALNNERITEDERIGVQYELALCHEATGDFGQARTMLTEIITARPTYSDVAARLENLPS